VAPGAWRSRRALHVLFLWLWVVGCGLCHPPCQPLKAHTRMPTSPENQATRLGECWASVGLALGERWARRQRIVQVQPFPLGDLWATFGRALGEWLVRQIPSLGLTIRAGRRAARARLPPSSPSEQPAPGGMGTRGRDRLTRGQGVGRDQARRLHEATAAGLSRRCRSTRRQSRWGPPTTALASCWPRQSLVCRSVSG
jgi:hypothetical protein